MNDEYYYENDDGTTHDISNDNNENELREIEGIESDDEYAITDEITFETETAEQDSEFCTTPDSPMYDPKTGERIPKGITLKEWRRRKRAKVRNQTKNGTWTEQDNKVYEYEQEYQKLSDREATHGKWLGRNASKVESEIESIIVGDGRANIISEKRVRNNSVSDERSVVSTEGIFSASEGKVSANTLDNDTRGHYGNKNAMAEMLDKQCAINEALRLLINKIQEHDEPVHKEFVSSVHGRIQPEQKDSVATITKTSVISKERIRSDKAIDKTGAQPSNTANNEETVLGFKGYDLTESVPLTYGSVKLGGPDIISADKNEPCSKGKDYKTPEEKRVSGSQYKSKELYHDDSEYYANANAYLKTKSYDGNVQKSLINYVIEHMPDESQEPQSNEIFHMLDEENTNHIHTDSVYANGSNGSTDTKDEAFFRNPKIIREGFEALGSAAIYSIRAADDSEENDVKRGINLTKSRLADIRMILGISGMIAASSLDTAIGARQSDLMAKLQTKNVDINQIVEFIHRYEGTNGAKSKSIQTRTRANLYRKGRAELEKSLQEQGLKKYEARDILRRRIDGKSIAHDLAIAMAAKEELLDAVQKHKKLFTEKEKEFLESKDFFNTAKYSRKISALTGKYFKKSENEYLKSLNPGASYLSALKERESIKKLGPNVIGRQGFASKLDAVLNMQSYNLNINLTKEAFHNKNSIKLERQIKKKPDFFTRGEKAVVEFQKITEKHSAYVERRKVFNRTKYSIKNLSKVVALFFTKLDADTTNGLDQVLSVKHGVEAAYSLSKLGVQSVWTAAAPVRFIARKTGVTGKVTGAIENAKGNAAAIVKAKKIKVSRRAKESAPGRNITKAGNTLKTAKPVVGVRNRIQSAKTIKQDKKRKIALKKEHVYSKVMNNPVGRILAAPFKGISTVAHGLNKFRDFFTGVGHWILLAIGVTIVVWLTLLFVTGFLMSLGKSIDISGRYVIMAEQDSIEEWVRKYLVLDDDKYEEAISHADSEPVDPHAWGGEKLYHYGVYEPVTTPFFNRSKTNCYYHEKGKQPKADALKGFHVFYIDKDGNTIGNNTTNIKDVISVTTAMIGNDWYSYEAETAEFMDQIYDVLNPATTYVESEIYACTNGCDTYPRKHIDGDPDNGDNWYDSAYKAYECSDEDIYTKYEQLVLDGVRFFPDDTYTYSQKEHYEQLVPQTEKGCNKTASFSFSSEKVSDGYYEEYITTDMGITYPDPSSWVAPEYECQLDDTTYDTECGGYTNAFKADEEGSYYRNTNTTPYTYAFMSYSDNEHVNLVQNAGFYGLYARDYLSTIPHTAIKCCYGHKDLNIYITVLTKEDLIEANGGEIEYRVPVHFSHETGEITEWETKKTESIVTYSRMNSNLHLLTKAFYDKGGFKNSDNQMTIDQICGEDWYELYGINVYSGAAIPDTLSRQANIDRLNYTKLADVSELRKALVQTAYSQVGKIPYYWGGKASSKNIYSNDFGAKTKPDYRRRDKKGLDCSGFVQLMFCIASGAELNEIGGNTKSLVPSLGLERISYSELQPGDLGMENLPGADSNHIGIYAGDGMWIHCAGAPANTVVYNNSNCFRFYYSLGR